MVAQKVVNHVWEPLDKQLEVMNLIAGAPIGSTLIIGYGGAAGGGKSNLIVNLAITMGLTIPGCRLLIGRQDFLDLKDTTLRFFDDALPPGVLRDSYNSAPVSRTIAVSPNVEPSVIMFRGLDDWQSLMSDEFGWVFIDEANEVPTQAVMGLLTRLRHVKNKKWGMVVGFNPFPSWCVDWFIDGLRPDTFKDNPLVKISFVQSLMDDNKHLRPGYKEMLEQVLDPYMRAVMVEGKAEVIPNAVFPMLQANKHWLWQPWDPEKNRLVRCGVGVDWGTTEAHKSAMVVVGTDKDGLHWVLDCWMSSHGSSIELTEKLGAWKDKYPIQYVRYDRSQGSLKDDLLGLARDVEGGIRDVDGRIRHFLGLLDPTYRRIRFNESADGVKGLLWRELVRYHRDEDSKIVEEHDDSVDALLYAAAPLDPHIGTFPSQHTAKLTYAGSSASRQQGFKGLG